MKILAWDLSTARGSLALAEGNCILAERTWLNDRRTSAPFFAVLDEIVSANRDLDRIVVGLGPGSYTGTRIGIAAAVGLALSTGAKLGGVPSITGMAQDCAYHVIGDARRSSFFWADVQQQSLVAPPQLLSPAELDAKLAAATLPIYSSDELRHSVRVVFPSAGLLARQAWQAPEKLSRAPLAPIYLREPHITTPRRQK